MARATAEELATRKKVTRKPTDITPPAAAVLSGELRGCQTPANHIVPLYVSSMGDDAVQFLRLCGIHLDEWQELVLRESLNVDSRGKWAATEQCLLVPRQQGKVEPLDADILTCDNGWKKFGQLTVGDRVFNPDGTPESITYITENHHHEFYRVTTTDGRTGLYGANHLWTVTDKRRERSTGPRGARRRAFETVTISTREMFETGLSRYARGSRTSNLNGKTYRTNEYRYVLPRQNWLSGLEKRDLPLDPYILGAWLGDGTAAGGQLTTGDLDADHWISTLSAFNARLKRNANTGHTINTHGLQVLLRQLGVLNNKHIPDHYLLADEHQREALLQGLLDTDGCIVNGQIEFCNTNLGLAQGVLFLARSLGWRAVLNEGRATLYGKDCGPKYRVQWTPTREDPFTPFRLPRKLAGVKDIDGGKGRFTVSVKSIEPVGTAVGRCIKVDREDGLYLSGRHLIPTHNTVVAEARELVGLFMLGEKLLVHQAQMFATAKESYLRQKARIESCPDLAALVAKYRSGNDNVGIETKTGGRLLYQARGPDSLRGFSIDVLVLDEAYALTPEVMAAALHATSAMTNPMIMYCSSTGREDSQVLFDLRDRALDRAPRIALWEWKSDDDGDPRDPAQWAKANPALGIRLSRDFIETEGNSGNWAKEFKRERMGLWADNSLRDVIPIEWWNACGDADSIIVGDDLVAAVDISPIRDRASIAMCGIAADGRRQLEVIETARGTDWVVDYLKKLEMSSNPPQKVVIQGGGAAGSFIAPLLQAGFELIVLGQADISRATGEFHDAARDKLLVHLDDPILKSALGNATKYGIGGKEGMEEAAGWGFARKDMNAADITPIVACCYAFHGMSKLLADRVVEEAKKPVGAHVGTTHGGRLW